MQAKLRVRISLQQKRKKYVVTKDDVLQTIVRLKSHNDDSFNLDDIFNDIDNFNASISVIKPSNLLDLGFAEGLEYYSPELKSIAVGTIELGTHLKPNQIVEFPTNLNYIAESVVDKFKQIDCDGVLFVFTKNNYNKTSSFNLNKNSFLKKFMEKSTKKHVLINDREKRIDIRYRFFLDDIMLIERTYPKELSINEQLEEALYVEIEPGSHRLEVEMLTSCNDLELAITDMSIESQILRSINDTSCSFEFH